MTPNNQMLLIVLILTVSFSLSFMYQDLAFQNKLIESQLSKLGDQNELLKTQILEVTNQNLQSQILELESQNQLLKNHTLELELRFNISQVDVARDLVDKWVKLLLANFEILVKFNQSSPGAFSNAQLEMVKDFKKLTNQIHGLGCLKRELIRDVIEQVVVVDKFEYSSDAHFGCNIASCPNYCIKGSFVITRYQNLRSYASVADIYNPSDKPLKLVMMPFNIYKEYVLFTDSYIMYPTDIDVSFLNSPC